MDSFLKKLSQVFIHTYVTGNKLYCYLERCKCQREIGSTSFNGNNKNKYSFGANACCREETVILKVETKKQRKRKERKSVNVSKHFLQFSICWTSCNNDMY